MKNKRPTVQETIEELYRLTDAFNDRVHTGVSSPQTGPCGPVAAALREAGVGKIQYGNLGPRGSYSTSAGHCWIRRPDGRILDLVNSDKYNLDHVYWGFRTLRSDEMPLGVSRQDIEFVKPYLERAGYLKHRTVSVPRRRASTGGKRRHTPTPSRLGALVADVNRLTRKR
jgi:hypothetical protein